MKAATRHARRLSPKRAKIMATLAHRDTLTLDEATTMIGGDIYANREKHVGALLGAMVRAGLIARVKPGVFRKA